MTTTTTKRPPTWATQRRRALRDGARGPVAQAVALIRDARWRDRGLSIGETGLARLALGFAAGAWMAGPELNIESTESGDSGGAQ